eukprot:6287659-Amphidinium_carterae.1
MSGKIALAHSLSKAGRSALGRVPTALGSNTTAVVTVCSCSPRRFQDGSVQSSTPEAFPLG